jgi:hypothetical protein
MPMSSAPARLYEHDFVRWTETQAAELRRAAETGTNLPLDWEHLAEEVESLGSRERWEIAEILADSPSLRREIAPAQARRRPSARLQAVRALAGEFDESVLPRHGLFTVEQLLEAEWWPERTGS